MVQDGCAVVLGIASTLSADRLWLLYTGVGLVVAFGIVLNGWWQSWDRLGKVLEYLLDVFLLRLHVDSN